MKAVSGNFTLSHACSHVGLPRANSLPVSAAERGTGCHLLETLALNKLLRRRGGGWLVITGRGGCVVLNVVVKSDSNARTETVHPYPEGLFGVDGGKKCSVTDLSVLKWGLTRTGSSWREQG